MIYAVSWITSVLWATFIAGGLMSRFQEKIKVDVVLESLFGHSVETALRHA